VPLFHVLYLTWDGMTASISSEQIGREITTFQIQRSNRCYVILISTIDLNLDIYSRYSSYKERE
jgi:hypothetical protein